jgi:three-Cys-motif partner protein
MSSKHYDFRNGPGIIQQHSIAKHRILESYLAAYFQTLGSSPNQDVLRLTLIDGFAGGGQYVHADTQELVFGSPFICLNAVKEASFLLNRDRRKPLALDVSYFFIEADRHAHAHLEQLLRSEGYGSALGNSIHLRHAKFQNEANDIIAFVKKRSPRNGRSIFVLDQYGYKDVPAPIIRTIFSQLPSAEVILTFGVDSFLNFASDTSLTSRLLDGAGLNTLFRGMSVQEIKQSEREWRLFIQAYLYRDLVEACGARYYTPFFIRNNKGHGDYWLIHMSQHHRARDVMTEVHWKHNNYFIHYGGAGLDMFNMVGYDPDRDAAAWGQFSLGFEFDDVAHSASVAVLMDQIAHLIHSHEQGMSFGELFATTCNGTPASAAIYREAIEKLIEHKAVEAVSMDGVQRRSAQQVHDSDRIRAPTQKVLFV